jgi:hypothetical protein
MTSGANTLYLDCFSGVSGDMFTGALLDLGVPLARLKKVLAGLPLEGYEVRAEPVERGWLAATHFVVDVHGAPGHAGKHGHEHDHGAGQAHSHAHRGLPEIEKILAAATIPAPVRALALKVVRRLADAEARVHRIPVADVHLHEVGAVDAIVDIVAGAACLHLLGVERVECSPLPLGGGTVSAEHGTLPVPAPATLELVRGVPVRPGPVEAELVTPTGAALVTTVAKRFGPPPAMTIEKVGHGAGSREFAGHANVLRAWWGRLDEAAAHTDLTVLEASLDDLNPQVYGYLLGRLLDTGALDVYYTPVQMKKNRPGTLVTVLARPQNLAALEEVLFEETSTLGVRSWTAARRELERRTATVSTPFGKIPVKVAGDGRRILHAAPEYDACALAARRHRVPLKQVQQAALKALPARLQPSRP